MVKIENLTLPAAGLGEENPMPDIKNVSYIHAGYEMTPKISEDEKTHIGKGMINTMLPYRIQDGYDRERELRDFKALTVENKLIRAVFLPELGGRLYSLTDKRTEKELLYVNPVFQPGNLGLRNAWFSGGVEFNVGIKGHNPLTCSPLHAVIDKTPDGDVLRLYEYERIRGVVYSVSAWVKDDSPVLYIRCRIENLCDDDKYMYWWSNIAVPETHGTRVIVPTDDAFVSFYNENHYILDKTAVPYANGTDISYPSNIPASRDFFYKIPSESHKWIASADEEGKGLLQCSSRKLFGRKMFVWGMGQGGRHWNEWLSDGKSSYIEIQAGLAHTQLEHIPMKAGETWEWTEAYTLLEGNPEVLHGHYKDAVGCVEGYLQKVIGNPDEMYFPSDDSVTATTVAASGSDWGSLEETLRKKRISKTLSFPRVNGPETAAWRELLEKGTFPTECSPSGYVCDERLLEKLEALPEQSANSLLHTGVIRYALYANGKGNLDSAKKAWEESCGVEENPWAMRNLAMLYANEYGDRDKARELLLRAFAMKPDCRALAAETAMRLTADGFDEKWLELYETLPEALRKNGRLRLCRAAALIHLDRLSEASEIVNEDFVMPDVKEGELSVSHLWFELHRRIYAKENGMEYSETDAALASAADKKYPLPKSLDFRMH